MRYYKHLRTGRVIDSSDYEDLEDWEQEDYSIVLEQESKGQDFLTSAVIGAATGNFLLGGLLGGDMLGGIAGDLLEDGDIF